MKASETLINALKRELRARGVTYRQLAPKIGLSEASVKRLFAQGSMDLKRLDAVLEAIGADPDTLLRAMGEPRTLLDRMSWDQEAEIVADPRLFAVAVCALSLLSFEQMTSVYRISAAECVSCLLRLERLGLLELHANNRYRLRLARTFSWLPEGPIVRYFRSQAADFLEYDFSGPGEVLGVVNMRLSTQARLNLRARLLALLADYSDQHVADARLPLAKRHPVSVLIGVRGWEPVFMRKLRRLDDAALARWVKDQR
jgi:transcriptional regulator with XRE-family HTH domain